MQIIERLKDHATLSFEVFPPKLERPIEPLLGTLSQLYRHRPDFISCTYGAGGTNKGRNLEVVKSIQQSGVCEALSHYTCVGSSRADVDMAIDAYAEAGVDNMLALRGDFPPGTNATQGFFSHANELIAYIRARKPALCVAAGCYPEKHLLADSLAQDIEHLRRKQDAGASFLITQLCHSVENFLRFRDAARARGVTLPIVVGVMPIIKRDGLVRMTLSNGCSIPAELAALIGRYGENEADFRAAGHDFTAELIRRYRAEAVNGIHLYTLNRYEDVAALL